MNSDEKKIGKFGIIFFFADILLIFLLMLTSDLFHLENILPDSIFSILYVILAPGSLLGFFFPGEDLSFMILPFIASPVIWLIIGMILDSVIRRRKN